MLQHSTVMQSFPIGVGMKMAAEYGGCIWSFDISLSLVEENHCIGHCDIFRKKALPRNRNTKYNLNRICNI